MKKIKHILSYSTGKDSQAMRLFAIESGRDFECVMADTGNEHPLTLEYARTIHERDGGPVVKIVKADFSSEIARKRRYIASPASAKTRYRYNKKLNRKKRVLGWKNSRRRKVLDNLFPTGNPFLDLMMFKGRFASTKARFCTSELKIAPIFDQVHDPLIQAGYKVLSWQGVRRDESLARAKLPKWEKVCSDLWSWRPLLNWSVEDVFAMHRRHGIEPNPLYKMGMGRVGCMPCINARKAEISEISTRFPEVIDRIEQWESQVCSTSKRGISTFFPSDRIPGKKLTRSRIREVEIWAKTSHGGRQFNMLSILDDQPACSSQYGLCE